MDSVLQQSVLYGSVTTVLLSPSLPMYMPAQQGKWLKYLRKPVLMAVLLYLFYVPMSVEWRNFYSLLEVDIHASKNDIIQGYRNVSKKYHPDKIAASGIYPPSFDGLAPEDYFLEVKKAQEVLTHDVRKSFYDRFGDLRTVGELDEKTAIIAVCLSLVVHLLCYCVGYLVSYFKHVVFARQIFIVYNIAVFCIELQQRFIEDDDSLTFLPYVSGLLPFEKIQFLRALFPFILVGSLCLAAWQFTDTPAKQFALLKAILSTNRVLTERTQELIRCTAFLKSMGTPSTAALKTSQQLQHAQSLHSAALKVRTSGVDVSTAFNNTAATASNLPKDGNQSCASQPGGGSGSVDTPDWDVFTSMLTDEQKEQFKRIIGEQYRRTEAEDQAMAKQRRRFDVNWSQLLMWVCVFFVWIYYK